MIEIESVKHIKINLKNGVYVFDSESGAGKTYITKLINSIADTRNFICVTASSYWSISSLFNVCKENKVQLIFLDRYDLYKDSFTEDIVKLKDNTVILIDCKHTEDLKFDFERCRIKQTESSIEVYGYDNI